MADLETLDGVLATQTDDVAQMSVVPLATRMRMAADDNKLARPNYYHIDDALRMSYDDIMSKQTDTQLLAKRTAESQTTSDTSQIIRATTENYITNVLNKPEKAVLAIGNLLSATGSTIGKDWASWANEAINDYLDQNLTSQRAGDAETWASRITGGVLSAAEYMMAGMVARPLADVSMGIDILGQATKNDIDRYIAETGDTALADYKANLKDVAINTLNLGAQLYIEDKLGFGRILDFKTKGATEFLSGFAQEFFQGTLEDIAESAKGNQEWKAVWDGVVGNVKDGVVGALLQGPFGLAAHHHYVSVAENSMKDFFVKNGMEEKAAQQKAHELRLRLEKEVAPMVLKQDKAIYDLVMQKGSIWGSAYDVAYNALRLTDQTGMTEEQMGNRATEIADQIASTVLESAVKDGLDLSEARIGFNPVDNTVYVNDKKSLDVKQALKEIEELDAEPATKEDVKQAVAEEKQAEQKKQADQTKPVSAIDPKAPFNKTKEKSTTVKALVNGVADGTIKLNKTEKVRYSNLLRDKQNGKPTTNEQMEKFAQKMVDKYMPTETAQPTTQPVEKTQETAKQEVRKPNKYDVGAKRASQMSKTLQQNAPAELAEEMAKEMEGEYNQRMTKDAVSDAVNFALSSDENMQIAIDAVMNNKEVDGIRPFEMYAGLLLIATKYNHPLLFEQLRQSPIHQGLARQAGQDISALQFTTESGMINIMKVVGSLEDKMAEKEKKNQRAIKKATDELVAEINNIEYTDDEVADALEKLEC